MHNEIVPRLLFHKEDPDLHQITPGVEERRTGVLDRAAVGTQMLIDTEQLAVWMSMAVLCALETIIALHALPLHPEAHFVADGMNLAKTISISVEETLMDVSDVIDPVPRMVREIMAATENEALAQGAEKQLQMQTYRFPVETLIISQMSRSF